MDNEIEANKRVGILCVLLIYEYIFVTIIGDETKAGMTMRELKKDPNTLCERFDELMVEFIGDVDTFELEDNYRDIVNLISRSYERNGISVEFTNEIMIILRQNNNIKSLIDRDPILNTIFKYYSNN